MGVMMSLLIILIVLMTGPGVINQQLDSPIPQVEYETVQSLTLPSTSHCRGNLTTQSEMLLKKLIHEERKQLLYLKLNFTPEIQISTNYSSILHSLDWVWVENSAGRPLLELDFRYHVYSLTTLSLDVGHMTMNIILPEDCQKFEEHQLMDSVSSNVKQALGEANDLKSSICHSRLSTYNTVSARFYVQYKCCDISMPGKYDHYNNNSQDQPCLILKKDVDGTFVNTVFFLLFLVSPLLLKVLHVREEMYLVTQTDEGITINDPYATLDKPNKESKRKTPPVEEFEMEERRRSTASYDNVVNNNEHNDNLCNAMLLKLTRNKFRFDNGSDSARGSSRNTDDLTPHGSAATLSYPSSDSLSVNKRHSARISEYDEAILNSVLSRMAEEDCTNRDTRSSFVSTTDYRISKSSDTSNDSDEPVVVPAHDHNCNGCNPNPITSLVHGRDMARDNKNSLNSNRNSLHDGAKNEKKNSIVEIDCHGSIARIVLGNGNSYLNSSNNDDKIQGENKGLLYIVLDSSTPLRLSKPIKHMFLLNQRGDWLCRVRRFCFFTVLYPAIMYLLIFLDICLYSGKVRQLYLMEQELDIPGKITDLEIFDHFWLGTFFTYPTLSVASLYLCMYVLMTFILAMKGNLETVLSTLTESNEYLGCIKLPSSLCRPCDTKHGFLLLYQKMQYRFSLIWEPRFWLFWCKEVVHTFTKPCCKYPSPKCLFHRPFKMAACFLCLLWLFPLLNCIPCDNIMQIITQKRKAGELQNLLRTKYKTRSYGKVVLILTSVLIVTLGLVFALLIFLKSCKVVTLFVLYTIKGIVKNYMNTLPVVSILVVAMYYLLGTTHRLNEKYKSMKKVVFEECIVLQNEMDEGKCAPSNGLPLVVYNKEGIPMIPKQLYERIIEKHMPLRENEFYGLLKIFLIAIFLVYVALTVDAFQIANVTTLGQAIATFFAATLPKLFEFFYGRDPIKTECLKFRFRETIKQCYMIDLLDRPGSNQTDEPTSSELPCAALANITCALTNTHKETSV